MVKKAIKKEEFEEVVNTPKPETVNNEFKMVENNNPPVSSAVKEDITEFQVDTIIKNCEVWGTVVQVTQWVNKTGFDILLGGSNGSFQHLSITKEEEEIVHNAIMKLNTKV